MTYVLDSANVINAGVQGGLKSAAVAGGMEGGIGTLVGGFDPVSMAITMALQAIYDKTKSTPSKNAGFLTSRVPGAKADQIYALDPFESGFTPYGFGRRTNEGDVREISDKFRTVDSTLSQLARDAGLTADYSQSSPFQGYDEQGLGTGAFYGYAGAKDQAGTPLDKQLTQFAKQWVSGLVPTEERGTLDQAITLEDVLNTAAQIFSYKKQGGVLTDRGWVNADGELIGTPPIAPVYEGGGGGQSDNNAGGTGGAAYPGGVDNPDIEGPWNPIYGPDLNGDEVVIGWVNDAGQVIGPMDDVGVTPEEPPAPADTDLDVNVGIGNGQFDFPVDDVLTNTGGTGNGVDTVDAGGTGGGDGTGTGTGSGAGEGPGEGDGSGGSGSNDWMSALLLQPGEVATPNPMAPLADIKYYFDVGGDSIFAPTELDSVTPRTQKPYDTPKGYSDLDQLMQYLRG